MPDDDRKIWEQVFRHVIESFDEKFMTLAHPEIRRLIWAAYVADQDGKQFFVGDALHSMSATGTPKPKRVLDDRNYSSKYKRLERVKGKQLLRVVSVDNNGKNKNVRPTETLYCLMSDLLSSTMRLMRSATPANDLPTLSKLPFALPKEQSLLYFVGHGVTSNMKVYIDCCAQGPTDTTQH